LKGKAMARGRTPDDDRITELLERIRRLNPLQVGDVERLVTKLECVQMPAAIEKESGGEPPHSKTWPHAPLHRLAGKGTFIVTAGTLNKKHHFRDVRSLDSLESELLAKAQEYGWQLEAWAVFSNHYHFVGHALSDAGSLKPFLSHLHSDTARLVNLRDNEVGRQVWYNFWETELTYESSYLARLNYVHQNAVHHGLVSVANQYSWCSAAWFERTATSAQVKTIYGFKTDKVRIVDDFDVFEVA
jgi:putative transposase